MARGRTAYLQGQREQEAANAEQERQRRLDTFNEYARQRQLTQTDTAQNNAMERAADALAARETIAARDAQIRDYQAKEQARLRQETLNRESGMDQTDPTKGWRGADRGARIDMNREDNTTALALQAARDAAAAARAAAQGVGSGRPKPLPPASRLKLAKELTAGESAIRDIDDAISATTGVKDYAGPWDNFRDEQMERFGQKIDPKRATARAMYAKVVTPILTGEFGANLTKLEKDYISPYITQLANASEQRIPIILGLIKRSLEQAQQEQMAMLEREGFDVGDPRASPARPPITVNAASETPSRTGTTPAPGKKLPPWLTVK
jgi:hypothetical protein